MRSIWTLLTLLLAAASIAIVLPHPAAAEGDDQAALVSEGERLVHVLDCNICHSPKIMTDQGPVPDPDRLLMGHPSDEIHTSPTPPEGWFGCFNADFTAWAGPWGVSYAFNLTPDKDTGIGTWSFDMFKNAIRTGKHMGEGRPILPPMPWHAYARLTDQELEAIFAYLRSIPPLNNAVPEPVMPASAH